MGGRFNSMAEPKLLEGLVGGGAGNVLKGLCILGEENYCNRCYDVGPLL